LAASKVDYSPFNRIASSMKDFLEIAYELQELGIELSGATEDSDPRALGNAWI
jgi:hypothetical protein